MKQTKSLIRFTKTLSKLVGICRQLRSLIIFICSICSLRWTRTKRKCQQKTSLKCMQNLRT
nr:MAG TPA: hypothetical protein [Caudoviricetes sp.]